MAISDVLDAVISRAKRLRASGVRVLCVDQDGSSLRLELEPAEPEIVQLDRRNADDDAHESSDPLLDPATYGRASGVPGFDVTDTDDDLSE